MQHEELSRTSQVVELQGRKLVTISTGVRRNSDDDRRAAFLELGEHSQSSSGGGSDPPAGGAPSDDEGDGRRQRQQQQQHDDGMPRRPVVEPLPGVPQDEGHDDPHRMEESSSDVSQPRNLSISGLTTQGDRPGVSASDSSIYQMPLLNMWQRDSCTGIGDCTRTVTGKHRNSSGGGGGLNIHTPPRGNTSPSRVRPYRVESEKDAAQRLPGPQAPVDRAKAWIRAVNEGREGGKGGGSRSGLRRTSEADASAFASYFRVLAVAERLEFRWARDPLSPWVRAWNWALAVLALYQVVVVPLRVAFGTDASLDWPLFGVDVVVDLVFVLDLVRSVSGVTGYFHMGSLVTSRHRSRARYVRSYLVPDAVAVVPLDLVQLALGRFAPALRLPKLLRVTHLWRADGPNQLSPDAEPGQADPSEGASLAKLLLWLLLWTHLLTCLRELAHEWDGITWSGATADGGSRASLYLAELLWAISFTTGRHGFNLPHVPQSDGEGSFLVLTSLVSFGVVAYLIGRIDTLAENRLSHRRAFDEQVHDTNRYMAVHNAPDDLRERVRAYYKFLWDVTAGLESSEAQHSLPPELADELRLAALRRHLTGTYLFDGLEHGFLALLAGSLHLRICIPGQFLIHKNAAVADQVFVVREGVLDVLDGNMVQQRLIACVGPGQVIGELGALGLTERRSVFVRARDYCVLSRISQADLLAAMKAFPASGQVLLDRAKQRMDKVSRGVAPDVEAALEHIFGTVSGWDTVRRYVLVRKVVRWLSTPLSGHRVVDPNSPAYRRFLVVVTAFSVWNVLSLPFRLAFAPDVSSWSSPVLVAAVLLADYAGDAALWADLVLRFRVGLVVRGRKVFNLERIRRLYMTGSFWTDLVSIFPVDLVALAATGTLNPWFRAARLIRARSVWHASTDALARSPRVSQYKLLRLAVAGLVMAHYAACCYWGIVTATDSTSSSSGSGSHAVDDLLAFAPDAETRYGSIGGQFMRSLVFAVTLLAEGSHPPPTTYQEQLFVCVGLFVSVFLMGLVLGSMKSVLDELEGRSRRHRMQASRLQAALATEGLTGDGIGRVDRFVRDSWVRQQGVDPNAVLQSLPKPLRQELVTHVYGAVLRSSPGFSHLDQEVFDDLAGRLRILRLPQQEHVFKQGMWGRFMYFVAEGLVNLEDEGVAFSLQAEVTSSARGHTSLRVLGDPELRPSVASSWSADSSHKSLEPEVAGKSAEETPGADTDDGALRAAAGGGGALGTAPLVGHHTNTDAVRVPNAAGTRAPLQTVLENVRGRAIPSPVVIRTRTLGVPEGEDDSPGARRRNRSISKGDKARRPTLVAEDGGGENVQARVVKQVTVGSHFGEGCFFYGRRMLAARTVSPVTLLALSKEDFSKVCTAHPAFAKAIEAVSDRRERKTRQTLLEARTGTQSQGHGTLGRE